MKLWLRLYGFEPCSWTFVWENLRQAFLDAGDEVADYTDPANPEDYIEMWWGDPQYWRWSSLPVKSRVSLCLSEAHSILAQGRRETINNLRNSDLLICPSGSATTAFKEAPIDAPIRVVQFGVNPDEFPYVSRNWGSDGYKFLHSGVTQFRKGSWLVPEAFVREFSTRDDVSLTIASRKVSPMFAKLKMEYGGHKQIDFVGDLLESSMDLYKTHHCFVSPHLSEGFGLCLAGDTLLTTRHGMFPIEKIRVGDYVLASGGDFVEVLGKNIRRVEELHELTIRGCEPIRITSEHPVALWEQENLVWCDAKDVKRGDKALIPLPPGYGLLHSRHLDVCDYIDAEKFISEEDCVYSPWGFSPCRSPSIATVSRELDYPKHVVERALRSIGTDDYLLPHYRYIQAYALLVGYRKPEPNKVTRRILVDDDFLKFVGWYLAEGSSNPERRIVTFSLGSGEVEIAEFLRDYAERTFGVKATISKRKKRNVLVLTISSCVLAEFMTAVCGDGAKEKKIHPDLFAFADKLLPLARAFIDGDGCASEERRTVTYATVSETLAYQIRYILLLNGFWVSLKRYPNQALGNYPIYKGRMAGNVAASYAGWERRRNNVVHRFVEWEDCRYVVVPVESNDLVQESLVVYNIETDKVHTFAANAVLVHNCIPEAMATGMPAIVARCSAPREYFDREYGWWVEMSEGYAPVEQCLPNTAGFWRLPDIESLAAAMREAYERRDESAKRGKVASEYVLNNLTWAHTVSRMKEVLLEEGICDTASVQRGKVVAIRSKEHRAAR